MVEKINVRVFRDADGYDCSNGGITSNHRSLTLYSGDRNECYQQAKEENRLHEALYLNKRILWDEPPYFAEPLKKGEGVQMFGGNYVGTCDGRYAAMLGSRTSYLLPVHDRYETQEEYDAMCRKEEQL